MTTIIFAADFLFTASGMGRILRAIAFPLFRSFSMKAVVKIVLGVASLYLGLGWLMAADDAKEEAIKKDRAAIKGEWKVVSYELDGKKPVSDEQLEKVKVTIDESGKVTVRADGQTIIEATTTIDPTKNPKTVDTTFTQGDLKGQTALGIYEIKGDTYKYCRAAPGKDRPTELSSKEGSEHTLLVYKRAKAE
jgi:uncharacterized protein (TIGR03067 family)